MGEAYRNWSRGSTYLCSLHPPFVWYPAANLTLLRTLVIKLNMENERTYGNWNEHLGLKFQVTMEWFWQGSINSHSHLFPPLQILLPWQQLSLLLLWILHATTCHDSRRNHHAILEATPGLQEQRTIQQYTSRGMSIVAPCLPLPPKPAGSHDFLDGTEADVVANAAFWKALQMIRLAVVWCCMNTLPKHTMSVACMR